MLRFFRTALLVATLAFAMLLLTAPASSAQDSGYDPGGGDVNPEPEPESGDAGGEGGGSGSPDLAITGRNVGTLVLAGGLAIGVGVGLDQTSRRRSKVDAPKSKQKV